MGQAPPHAFVEQSEDVPGAEPHRVLVGIMNEVNSGQTDSRQCIDKAEANQAALQTVRPLLGRDRVAEEPLGEALPVSIGAGPAPVLRLKVVKPPVEVEGFLTVVGGADLKVNATLAGATAPPLGAIRPECARIDAQGLAGVAGRAAGTVQVMSESPPAAQKQLAVLPEGKLGHQDIFELP